MPGGVRRCALPPTPAGGLAKGLLNSHLAGSAAAAGPVERRAGVVISCCCAGDQLMFARKIGSEINPQAQAGLRARGAQQSTEARSVRMNLQDRYG